MDKWIIDSAMVINQFYNQMSERKERDDMSSVRCNEVQT